MKCPRCGLSNPASARICTRCGAPLWNAGRGGTGTIPKLEPIDAESSGVRPVNAHESAEIKPAGNVPRLVSGGINPSPQDLDAQSSTRNPYSRSFIVTLVTAVLVGLGLITLLAAVLSCSSHETTAATTEANKTSLVEVSFDIPGYVQGTSSQIPIAITGNDASGAAVNQIEYMSLVDNSVSLKQGNYTFTPVCSPVTKGGTIFVIPAPAEVAVESDGVKVNGSAADGPTFEYTAIPADQTTDAQVQAIRSWMVKNSQMESTTISSYINAIASARLEALNHGLTASQINKAQRGTSFATSSFAFLIPSNWKGEVQTIIDINEYGLSRATIYAADTRYPLAWVQTVPKDATQTDIPETDRLVESIESPSGSDYRVEVWSRNWAGIAAANAVSTNSSTNASTSSSSNTGTSSYDASSLSVLIRLSTGGTLAYRQVIGQDSDEIGTPDIEFLREALIPSITVA